LEKLLNAIKFETLIPGIFQAFLLQMRRQTLNPMFCDNSQLPSPCCLEVDMQIQGKSTRSSCSDERSGTTYSTSLRDRTAWNKMSELPIAIAHLNFL
jgi:hypothetical protein